MGTLVVHVGELGQGEMLKLINNSLGAANAAALAEALLRGARRRAWTSTRWSRWWRPARAPRRSWS